MTSPPEPANDVPDFLHENFESERSSKLRAVAAYADDSQRRSGVPQYIRNAFTIQDDDVVDATAAYAAELADYLEAEGYETLEEVPEGGGEDRPDDAMGSAFSTVGRSRGDDDDDDDDGLLGGLIGD
jgi:hypothetical protein